MNIDSAVIGAFAIVIFAIWLWAIDKTGGWK
jgi:hypothetical protein